MPRRSRTPRKKILLKPPTPAQLTFGQSVRRCRELLGWSQLRLAHYLGYDDAGMISMIEHGLRSPTLWRGVQLAQLFGVPLAVLYGLDPVFDPE